MVTFRRYLPTILCVLVLVLAGTALYSLGLYAAGKSSVTYCAINGTLALLCAIGGSVAYRYQPAPLDTKNTALIGQLASNYARTGDTEGLEIVKNLSSHDRGVK